MSLRIFIFSLILLSLPLHTHAQTSLDVSGLVRSHTALFTRDWNTFASADNLLRMDLRASRGEVSAHTRLEFWYDGLRSTHGLQDNPFGTPLREFQVYVPVGPVDLRLGKQLILWGTADELNPTDVINPEN